jgi:hypothetical protein
MPDVLLRDPSTLPRNKLSPKEKLGMRFATGTTSPPIFRLRLATITNKRLPRPPPQEKQVDTHKPVSWGDLRSASIVYRVWQSVTFLFIQWRWIFVPMSLYEVVLLVQFIGVQLFIKLTSREQRSTYVHWCPRSFARSVMKARAKRNNIPTVDSWTVLF